MIVSQPQAPVHAPTHQAPIHAPVQMHAAPPSLGTPLHVPEAPAPVQTPEQAEPKFYQLKRQNPLGSPLPQSTKESPPSLTTTPSTETRRHFFAPPSEGGRNIQVPQPPGEAPASSARASLAGRVHFFPRAAFPRATFSQRATQGLSRA